MSKNKTVTKRELIEYIAAIEYSVTWFERPSPWSQNVFSEDTLCLVTGCTLWEKHIFLVLWAEAYLEHIASF